MTSLPQVSGRDCVAALLKRDFDSNARTEVTSFFGAMNRMHKSLFPTIKPLIEEHFARYSDRQDSRPMNLYPCYDANFFQIATKGLPNQEAIKWRIAEDASATGIRPGMALSVVR